MAGFRYFLPGISSAIAQGIHLPDARLRATLGEKQPLAWGHLERGPEGQSGTILATSGESLAYEPAAQRWEPVLVPGEEGKIAYFVGMYTNERRPTAEDLEREQRLPGCEIRFRDDSVWLVPELHVPHGPASVPRTMRYVAGKFELAPDQRYDAICTRASDMYRRVFKPPVEGENHEGDPLGLEQVPDAPECFQFVADVLGVNYRVGPVECALLEIFALDWHWMMNEFFGAVFGIRTLLAEMRKKKEDGPASANLSTSAGELDLVATIDPVSAT